MLTESADVVIGVDTHAERHALCLLDARSGLVLAACELPASRAGYREALRFACRRGRRRVWALEGTGCYGAGLARLLERKGERVLEVERPARRGREGRLKSDRLDAERAARAVLAGDKLATPRRGGEREALRLLLTVREQDVGVRRDGLNELRALLVTAPAQLRERLRALRSDALVAACRRLRRPAAPDPAAAACTLALRSCAERVAQTSTRAEQLEREITQLVRALCPQLLAQHGIGPISAGYLLLAWSHKGRLRSEAAFARLGGVAPIPASSGRIVRHRLDRGGDRKLNRALHTILLSRRRTDPNTIAYLKRRLSEGKTEREAIRCLKRYLARSLYRLLERTARST